MRTREAIILSIGIIIAFTIFGTLHYKSRVSIDSVKVVGSASNQFSADIVKWQLMISRPVKRELITEGYTLLNNDISHIVNSLVGHGIDSDGISIQPVGTSPVWSPQGGITSYNLQQTITIISKNLDSIESLAQNPAELVSKGIIIENSRLEYFFSGVDELKHQLLGRAAQDARKRAEEIAGSTGMTVGGIREARAGVF